MTTFSYVADFGAASETKPNVRATRYGDGYEQRQANGLNTMPKTWALTFSLRDDTEANGIEAFLAARGGVDAFDWTDINGASGRYVCRSWRRVKDRYNLNTVSATFEQVYEP